MALIRVIFAQARQRHQARPSFQARMLEDSAQGAQPACADRTPTLWRLKESSQILREVFRDVLAAVKVCSSVDVCLLSLQQAVVEHKERLLPARVRRHMSQICACGILTRQLSNPGATESDWHKLAMEIDA